MLIEEEEEEHEDCPHMVDGIEYTKVWDEDDKEWLVTFDDEHVGWPGTDGEGIRFADDDEEKAHAERVEEKE